MPFSEISLLGGKIYKACLEILVALGLWLSTHKELRMYAWVLVLRNKFFLTLALTSCISWLNCLLRD